MNRRCLWGALAAIFVFVVIVAAARTTMTEFIEFSKGLQTALSYMGLTLPMAMFLIFCWGLALGMIWMFWRAQHDRTNPLDITLAFQKDGKTSGDQIIKIVFAAFSLFIMGWLALNDKMTEGYLTLWLLCGFGLYAGGRALDVWKQKASGDDHRGPAPDPRIDKG